MNDIINTLNAEQCQISIETIRYSVIALYALTFFVIVAILYKNKKLFNQFGACCVTSSLFAVPIIFSLVTKFFC